MALITPPDNNDSHSLQPSHDTPVDASATGWLSRLETLQSLAAIVREEKLGELEVRLGGARLKLQAPEAKRARSVSVDVSPAESAANDFQAQDDLPRGATSAATSGTSAASGADANLVSVVSPMVGLFYRAPSPSDPVFVSVGDRVEVGQTLGLIETMKVFNEITSEVEGTVVSIAYDNGQLIETGDAVMMIRRS